MQSGFQFKQGPMVTSLVKYKWNLFIINYTVGFFAPEFLSSPCALTALSIICFIKELLCLILHAEAGLQESFETLLCVFALRGWTSLLGIYSSSQKMKRNPSGWWKHCSAEFYQVNVTVNVLNPVIQCKLCIPRLSFCYVGSLTPPLKTEKSGPTMLVMSLLSILGVSAACSHERGVV